ncbi:MAG TPA: FkbM family methyltransferase [Candidatus Competibacteraceae bacterium]|nr:FkbM family methyltransferase [Candidatus Competibacteraceae bacterium]HPF58161.1 FkbM family methyltransferase [Candidatus Competibacteraceae bacterium]
MYDTNKKTNKIKYKSEDVDLLVEQIMPLLSQIEKDFGNGVAVYGAGFVGTWACQYLRSIGAKIKFFIDKDPQKEGTSIYEIPVFLPTDPVISSVSSIFIAARHAIKDVLMSITNKTSNAISFDGYYVAKNYEKFISVRDNFFTDEKSIETYNAILTAMLTGSTKSCREVMEKDMYFSIPEFSGTFNEIFVDAGAFVGDTVERFIWENLGTFKHIYAFEPGLKQFLSLQKRVSRLSEEWAFELDCISMVKAGLSSENGYMVCSFLEDSPIRHGLIKKNSESEMDALNSSEVYSLDSFLRGKPVTFIKADIEGMEMDFLQGAQETICCFKPKMALCAYHYPSDLFEIAEYVRKLVPEYKFSLRQHAPIFGDFVLYCYID